MLCSTSNEKLNALRKIRKYLTLVKVELLYNALIYSHFFVIKHLRINVKILKQSSDILQIVTPEKTKN